VTNLLKLFERSGKPNASLCVLNSLTLPSPTFSPGAPPASFGKFGGKSDDSSKSETLVDSAEVGTLNFLAGGGCWVFDAAGGKEGRAETTGRGGGGASRSEGSGMG
jgi:hypothetical protein